MLLRLAQDFRHAASAILILAVGIAASTGLFTVIDAVMLHPLPYEGAERLARVQLLPVSGPARPAAVTLPIRSPGCMFVRLWVPKARHEAFYFAMRRRLWPSGITVC